MFFHFKSLLLVNYRKNNLNYLNKVEVVDGNRKSGLFFAFTNTHLNKFKRQWCTCLLITLTLRWIQRGTSGPLSQSRYFTGGSILGVLDGKRQNSL